MGIHCCGLEAYTSSRVTGAFASLRGSRGITSLRLILMLISWLWESLDQTGSINLIPNPCDSRSVVTIPQKTQDTFIVVNLSILTILKGIVH